MYKKEEILAEIRRTVSENGGQPLGSKAFQNTTNIGWYDWGRYWPSWGSALVEAGFEPNKKKTAYADEFLVKRMIDVIRKFGRYPSLSELRIEGYNSSFPYEPIKKRKKYPIISKIVEFCSKNKNYEDILEICNPLLKELEKDEKSKDSTIIGQVGEVYLFRSGRYYKVGKTYDSVRRGHEISIQLPEKITLIHSIKTVDPSGIETYWHKRFNAKRKNGEWFDLTPADIKEFKGWKRIV